MLVFAAHGSELERDFPFGMAIQLVEPSFSAADEHGRERLLQGPARHAGDILCNQASAAGASSAARGTRRAVRPSRNCRCSNPAAR